MALFKFDGHLAAALNHLPTLGTEKDSYSDDPQNPSFRQRLYHQLKLLKTQAMEECSSEQNLPAFVKLADAALAVFSIPVEESYAVELAVLEAQIREYSSKSESFLEILRI
jgi:hypothetical protein